MAARNLDSMIDPRKRNLINDANTNVARERQDPKLSSKRVYLWNMPHQRLSRQQVVLR